MLLYMLKRLLATLPIALGVTLVSFLLVYIAPNGVNWGGLMDPKVDATIEQVRTTFDTKKQDALLASLHQTMVDQALMLWVVHDVNPHALSPKVKQFVQAQHWFQDLTTIGM